MTAASIIRIVDDDPNIHDALAYVLENEGFIVRHYESAESFLINDRPALTDEAARQAALTEAARTAFLSLSDRERQAALLAVSGLTNRQIAERLEIAVRTVEFHRAGSMRKLGCHSAAELKAKLSLVPEAREAFE